MSFNRFWNEREALQQSDTGFTCEFAYNDHLDPVTLNAYTPNPTGTGGLGYAPCAADNFCPFPIPAGYTGFDPDTPAYNDGEGFAKKSGRQ